MQSPRIPGFNQAEIEAEDEELRDEFESESPIVGPGGEGAEVTSRRVDHPEPPAQDRGYRNLNE